MAVVVHVRRHEVSTACGSGRVSVSQWTYAAGLDAHRKPTRYRVVELT